MKKRKSRTPLTDAKFRALRKENAANARKLAANGRKLREIEKRLNRILAAEKRLARRKRS